MYSTKKRTALLGIAAIVIYITAQKIFLSVYKRVDDSENDIAVKTVAARNEGVLQDSTNVEFKEGVFPLPKRTFLRALPKPNDSVVPDMFYDSPVNISRHDFRLMLNPYDACLDEAKSSPNKNIFLLVMIASASWEFERRKIIRRTWASLTNVRGKQLTYLFFVGNDGKAENNQKLKREFERFHDIVQEDFRETYRNLSLKTQGQLKWATHFCSHASFYMHVDDDVVPDINSIIDIHIGLSKSSKQIDCAKVFKPIVRRDGKWVTSQEEYPGDQYPLSCVGWCFIMPRDVAVDLYYMSLDTPLLHLEDVAFTGIIREKIGNIQINKMENGEELCQHEGWPKDRPTNVKIIEAWKTLQKKELLV